MPVRLLQVTALAAFFCASAHAAPLQIPTNVPIVEVAQQTNTYNYVPVNENNSTIKRVVPISDALVTGQSVSDVEPKVSTTRRLPIGTGAEVTAKVTVPKKNIAKALVATAKGVGKLALPGAAALALDALLDFGISNIKVDGDNIKGEKVSDKVWPSNGTQYRTELGGLWGYGPTPQAACDSLGAYGQALFAAGQNVFQSYRFNGRCVITARGPGGTSDWERDIGSVASCPVGYYYTGSGSCSAVAPKDPVDQAMIEQMITDSDGWPSSASVALAEMLKYPDTRRIIQDYPSNGVEINGPASVKGKSTTATESVQLVPGTTTVAPPGTTTATQPGTKTTTTTATHPITYSGSSVSHSTVNNTTTNITNNTTNVTTTESKTEEVKDDKEPDQCQKYPDTIGCQKVEFDTPEGEIPRKKIDVTWSPVDLGLGGGSCPAPVQLYDNKQFSYQLACDNLYIIKPMVIAIALFVGGMIIFGGRADQ